MELVLGEGYAVDQDIIKACGAKLVRELEQDVVDLVLEEGWSVA
jgi:hypothetical protein